MDLLSLDLGNKEAIDAFIEAESGRLTAVGGASSTFPSETSAWPKALETVLADARDGLFADGIDADLMAAAYLKACDPGCGLDTDARDLVRDKALLVLWYLFVNGIAGESDSEALGSWLERLCSSVESEPSDFVRGRLVWLELNLLDERRADDDIESMLRRLHEAEKAPYVWERIASFLGGWTGTWRLYADLHSWPELAEREGFTGITGVATRQSVMFAEGLVVVEGYRQRLPVLVDAARRGDMPRDAINWIFALYAEGGFGFPLPIDDFTRIYREHGGTGRVLLLGWLDEYVKKAKEGALDRLYLAVIAEGAGGKASRLERIAARIAMGELARRDGDTDGAWRALLESLQEALRATQANDGAVAGDEGGLDTVAAQELYQRLQPRALGLIGQRDIRDPALDLIDPLLRSGSGYIQSLGVDFLLALSRAGHDVSALARSLAGVLAEAPETTGLMDTKGSDLGEPPVVPYFFVLHVGSFAKDAASTGDAEGGFMNLGKLTELLEVVIRPHTAWRAARLLRDIAEAQDDGKLLGYLSRFKDVNEVLSDLGSVPTTRSIKKPASAAKAPEISEAVAPRTRRFVPLEDSPLVGPLTVPEIADAMASLRAVGAHQGAKERHALRDALAASIVARGERNLSDSRHRAIAGVFGDGLEEAPGLFTMVYSAIKTAGGVVQSGRACAKKPDTWHPDAIACYQPRANLGQDEGHGYGIRFCAGNVMACAAATGSDAAALVRVVAVHEWFHAYMEMILGDTYVSHAAHHGHSGFCALEEAAANAVARAYLHNNLSPALRAPIESALFDEPERLGLSGYGEWCYMGSDAPSFVPALLKAGSHVDPPAYGLERTKGLFQFDSFALSAASGLWKSLLTGLEEQTVPCWIDFS